MPAHTEGREGNLLVGTQIQCLRMSGPLEGALGVPVLATHCVTLSLALFALGGVDLTRGFCCRTLSFGRPTTIM
jgi:hypothetical protein